ncbi:MAG TPA: hypothetical protein ENF17_05075 [Candidatus Aminicenantes bacterium]|nr:hypothetical protein [Candidatus Aminicenantes bacterium]
MFLGLDLGSFAGKAVLVDEKFKIKQSFIVLTRGDYQEALSNLFQMISTSQLSPSSLSRVAIGITGVGRHLFDWPAEIESLNEIVALVLGAHQLFP